ncbi:acetyl/propionyl/methylcrotonyl-CoA carboxylase subunit alpha [Homoserinimonas sp. A447]
MPLPQEFSTVLVANRGEVACRVIRTLRAMGIRSVAVYSDADRNARHVRMADVAVRIGPAPAQASYLNIDAVVAAAQATGAEAIHPGYGFLSENVDFARALETAGIAFIGPGVQALDLMGDKIRAKTHVKSHQVPVIAGIAEPGLTDAQLIAAAEDVGYPLLIKPSAGGGGKGMHVVERSEDLAETLVTARRVAAAAFGDDTLFLERYLATPRHIEVQVLADSQGNVIHLGERECSLQRRHQKVIEEAPSPLLDSETRARIGEAACEVARSVGYVGAGTIEFLVSDNAPTDFFFMEMNTRLQVEHPVTELVTGIDLVEWQLRIAAGEPLSLVQDDIRLTGHAVEARVYAESPARGFLPTTGSALVLDEPQGDGVRVDSSLVQGLEVASNYDPMLSKVIAWGVDRAEALARLDGALASTTVLGIETNIDYLRHLIADPAVQAGNLETGLIERMLPSLEFRGADDALLAVAALVVHSRETSPGSAWHRDGWRLGPHVPSRYRFAASATDQVDVLISGAVDAATIAIGDGARRSAALSWLGGTTVSLELDGRVTRYRVAVDGDTVWVGDHGFAIDLNLVSRTQQLADQLNAITRVAGAADPDVRSPMPGTVVAVNVTSGDSVTAGQTLLTVEAMKMEHKLLATVDGIVTITAKPADLVKLDQVVASIAPHTIAPQEGAEQEEAHS